MSKKTKVVMGPYAISGSSEDIASMLKQMTEDLASITQEDLDAMARRDYEARIAKKEK